MPKSKKTRMFRGRARSKSLKRPHVYDALRRKGFTKTAAAKISNAQARRGKKKKRKG